MWMKISESGRDSVGAWRVKQRRKKGKRKGWFLKRMEREKRHMELRVEGGETKERDGEGTRFENRTLAAARSRC